MNRSLSGPDYAFERARLDKTIEYCRSILDPPADPDSGTLFVRRRLRKSGACHAVFLHYAKELERPDTCISKDKLVLYREHINVYCANKVLPTAEKSLRSLINDPLNFSIAPLQAVFESLYQVFGKMTPAPLLPNRLRIESWLSTPITRDYRTSELIYKTARGDLVRSKFEVLVADALHSAGLPYLYELPLINERKHLNLLPDFTILDPQTGKIYFLEAFGMMDNPDYSSAMLRKLRKYESAGIFPGENLIVVYDGMAAPFDHTIFRQYLVNKFRL